LKKYNKKMQDRNAEKYKKVQESGYNCRKIQEGAVISAGSAGNAGNKDWIIDVVDGFQYGL
jgi:hypothetical protein